MEQAEKINETEREVERDRQDEIECEDQKMTYDEIYCYCKKEANLNDVRCTNDCEKDFDLCVIDFYHEYLKCLDRGGQPAFCQGQYFRDVNGQVDANGNVISLGCAGTRFLCLTSSTTKT